MTMSDAEKLAKLFHDTYEDLAPSHGYETREASRKPWDDVPANNKSLMIAVAHRVKNHLENNVGSFSRALDLLKAGGKVSRPVWGEGAYVVLQKGYPDGIAINANTAEATGEPEGTVMRFLPYLMVKLADGSFVPFVPTLDHLLAEDWQEGPVLSEEGQEDRLRWLSALEAAGVDNWQGYDEARRIYDGG